MFRGVSGVGEAAIIAGGRQLWLLVLVCDTEGVSFEEGPTQMT